MALTRRQGTQGGRSKATFCAKLTRARHEARVTVANPSTAASSNAAAWALLGAICGAVILGQWIDPLPIRTTDLSRLALACGAMSGLALFYHFVRPRTQFVTMSVGLLQVLLFSALGSILSYMVARDGGALWDARFAYWDRALGFDWLSYVRLADAHPAAAFLSHWAYGSLIPQVIVLIVVLGFTERLFALRTTLLAAMICGAATILLSALFPAINYFTHLGLSPSALSNLKPWAALAPVHDFNALRAGTMHELQLTKLEGIIAFPSYHAGLATVTLLSFWRSGIRWLRWSGSAIATATLLATPIEGGHYFVDVLAGMGIAIASVAAAHRMVRWQPTLAGLKASPSRHSRAASAR